MRIRLLFLAVFLCGLASAQPTKLWDKTYGGSGDDVMQAAVPTWQGGWLVGGTSSSGAGGDKSDTSRGGKDYWLVCVDSLGNKLWDKTYGGPGDDVLQTIARAPDGGYLLGGNSNGAPGGEKSDSSALGGRIWAVRIDSLGRKLWDRSYNISGERVDFALLPDSGWMLISVTGNLIRIDAAGEFLWVNTYPPYAIHTIESLGDSGVYMLSGEALDGDSLIVGGHSLVKVDALGNRLWENKYGRLTDARGTDSECMASMYGGGYVLSGRTSRVIHPPVGSPVVRWPNPYALGIDAMGNLKWQRFIEAPGISIQALAPTRDGGVLLGCVALQYQVDNPDYHSIDRSDTSHGGSDYWLLKLDENGVRVWDKTYGGSNNDSLLAIGVSAGGGLLLGGASRSPAGFEKSDDSHGGSDFWLVRLDPEQPLQLRNLLTHPATPGQTDGQIRLTPYGGVPPYEYSIDGGVTWHTEHTFTGLSAGTYGAVARDKTAAVVRQGILLRER